MRTKTSIEIFNYWDRIRGADAGPLRSDIEPGSIRTLLPNLFILEKGGKTIPTFRLAGTRICSLFGRELRNQAFSTIWPSLNAVDAVRTAVNVMDRASPALLDVTGFTESGKSLDLEMVLLPIRSTGLIFDRLLGALTPDAATPFSGLEPLQYLTFNQSRVLEAVNDDYFPPARPSETVSVATTRHPDLGGMIRRVLHLRIFDGGRA